jgi:hypothetical protein
MPKITVWTHETNSGTILSGRPRRWHAEQVKAGTHPCPEWAVCALRSGFVKSQAVGVVDSVADFHSMTKAVFALMRALGEPYLNDGERNTEQDDPERVKLKTPQQQTQSERSDPRQRRTVPRKLQRGQMDGPSLFDNNNNNN